MFPEWPYSSKRDTAGMTAVMLSREGQPGALPSWEGELPGPSTMRTGKSHVTPA